MSTTLQSQLQAVRNAVNTAGTSAARLDDALRIVAQVAEPPKGEQIAEFLDLLLNSPSQFSKDPATWVPSSRQRDALFAILGAPGQPVQSAQGTKPFPPYDVGGLLNVNRKTVWFKKLHRGLIALQLVIRVADPKRIEQKQHPLCGPTVLMESFARNYPEEYVQYVTDLYTTGTGQIKTSGGTRTVQLKPSSTLLKSEPNHNEIAEADYIALASLRDQGQWVIHTPYESRYTIRMLEGGTMAMTLARWLEEAGYQNVKDHTISRSKNLMAKMMLAPQARSAYGKWEMEKNVNNAINELTAGRTVFLCVATNFANFALQKPRDSWYVQSFAGHWATLLAGQIQPTGVDFSIRTWGEETAAPVTMPWSKVGNWYRGYISATP